MVMEVDREFKMARLTDEEKATNKAAKKNRDQAFRARRKVYEEAKVRALTEFHAISPLKQEMEAASAASQASHDARDAEEREIRAQIAKLEETIKSLSVKYQIEPLNEVRRRTNAAYFAAKSQVEKDVDRQFGDIAGVFSSVQWAAKVDGAQ